MAPVMCNAVVHCTTPDRKQIYFSLVSYGSLLINFGDLQAGRFVEQVLPNGLCHQRIGDDCFDIHRQMLMANEGGP